MPAPLTTTLLGGAALLGALGLFTVPIGLAILAIVFELLLLGLSGGPDGG
jgi:hypothetical protein